MYVCFFVFFSIIHFDLRVLLTSCLFSAVLLPEQPRGPPQGQSGHPLSLAQGGGKAQVGRKKLYVFRFL